MRPGIDLQCAFAGTAAVGWAGRRAMTVMRAGSEPGLAGYMHSAASEFISWFLEGLASRRWWKCHPRIICSYNSFRWNVDGLANW
jgi:hypothetical protein